MLNFLFWLSLLYWSLFPATMTPWLEIASIPVNSKDLVVVVVACIYLLVAIFGEHRDGSDGKHKNWHCYLPILTVALLIYAWFTMTFYETFLPQGFGDVEPMENRVATAMYLTLIFSAASFIIGYILIVKKSPESIYSFLWQLTVYLAGLGLFYSAVTLLGGEVEGVRSDIVDSQDAHGIIRVVGPLFGASTGHFILLPALGFSIQEFFRTNTQRLFKFGVMFSLMLTLVGLGSRAALLILVIFFIFLSLSTKNKKQVTASVVLLVVVLSAAGTIFFSQGNNTDRFKSLEDSARSDTHTISFQIIAYRDLEFNIVGSGYGSYWSWYLTNNEMNRNISIFMVPTRFGKVLYHPHSVFLPLIVELGIFGLLYFVSLWTIFVRLLIHNLRGAAFPIFNSGVVASGFSMFVDLFIFKGQQINTIWWIFLFGALATNHSQFSDKSKYNVLQQYDE